MHRIALAHGASMGPIQMSNSTDVSFGKRHSGALRSIEPGISRFPMPITHLRFARYSRAPE
jgi:hypothetical protein